MALLKKGNPLLTIVKSTCPACQEGDFFLSSNPYHLKVLGELHKNCPKCGQRFSLEPGFYFGAAYVSYAINVALMVACGLGVYLTVEEPEALHYIGAIFGFTLLLFPFIFRWSRLIWATLFIPFGGEKKQFKKSPDQ